MSSEGAHQAARGGAGDEAPLAPVSGLEISRDRAVRSRITRYATRAVALAALAAAAYLAWAVVQPVLPADEPLAAEQAPPATTAAEPPPRPEGIPTRIPAWAWEMHGWHSAAPEERGPRPEAAPRRLPEWYWEWRRWRLALENG